MSQFRRPGQMNAIAYYTLDLLERDPMFRNQYSLAHWEYLASHVHAVIPVGEERVA